MQIGVTFRHLEADEGAKDYVQEKVQRLQKYLVNPGEVHVVLSAEKFRHTAEITITGQGVTFNSQGRNSDLYAAIDQMLEKAERQIREQRGRARRKRPNLPRPSLIESSSKAPIRKKRRALGGKGEKGLPHITLRKHTYAKPMSLDEAVAQMELSQEEFLIFVNSDSEQMNVLRRGKDGGYEWVEPYAE
ncbi:MAG: ribosome hibernation-promoting factor, HPF/YfiA family [Thermodesulfobacteriota bacterium]